MSEVIVDTNVLAVAEGMHEDASAHCMASCLQLVRRITSGERSVVADEGDLILAEYVKTLKAAATAGPATKLARYLWNRRFDSAVCKRVVISPDENPPGSFEEIPADIRDFDVDDQKFLATAAAAEAEDGILRPIFQAHDGEWWDRRADLHRNGFDVQFLCAADLP